MLKTGVDVDANGSSLTAGGVVDFLHALSTVPLCSTGTCLIQPGIEVDFMDFNY